MTRYRAVPLKNEGFNRLVAFAVGAFVFQIVRSLGLNFGALTVVFLLVPWALLVRYGKKQSPQAYAGIIAALVVTLGIAISAGPGDVFIPQSVETPLDVSAPQPDILVGGPTPSERLLAQQGDADAQFRIARRYDTGQGVPEDDAEAVRLYRLAAEQGHANAQFSLGYKYGSGQGVPEDDAESVRWYRLAAEQGHANAQWALGVMYLPPGHGVPADIVLAYMWLNLAAAQGHEDAQEGKDVIEQQMTRDQIAEAQRLSTEWIEAHPPSGN